MTQQMRDLQLAQARKPPGPSSPNAAKRLYRNLSGKFRVNYTSFDEGSLAGRGEKEKPRKSYLVRVTVPRRRGEGDGRTTGAVKPMGAWSGAVKEWYDHSALSAVSPKASCWH